MIIFPKPKSVEYLSGSFTGSLIPVIKNDITLAKEEYFISVTPEKIAITASTDEGIFRAKSTLKQIIAQSGDSVQCVQIHDYPDLEIRGFMMTLNYRSPRQEELYRLADNLAQMKINHLQVHLCPLNFTFEQFPSLKRTDNPITPDDYRDFDTYCRERFIELTPVVESFGHFEKYLCAPEFEDLSDAPGSHILNPLDPRSPKMVGKVYDEISPLFGGSYINAGCDETDDLGKGESKSREACERYGQHRVFVDFINKLNNEIKARGKKMMYWADVLLKADADVVADAPDDALALHWGYFRDQVTDESCALLQSLGKKFCICPTTWTFSTLTGRSEDMILNIDRCASRARKYGALGIFNTDWNDFGVSSLTMSLFPMAYGAQRAWNTPDEDEISGCGMLLPDPDSLQLNHVNIAARLCFDYLDEFVFNDRRHLMARLAYDAGRIDRQCPTLKKAPDPPSSVYRILDGKLYHYGARMYDYYAMCDYIDSLKSRLKNVDLRCDDAEWIVEEYDFAFELLRSCIRADMKEMRYFDGMSEADFDKIMSDAKQELKKRFITICERRLRSNDYEAAFAKYFT